jgi:hypothetical protein
LLPDGTFLGHTSADYANMVGTFGGTAASCLLQAAIKHPACIGEPLALTVNYAAALVDCEFALAARAVRTHRSTQRWLSELSQSGEVATQGERPLLGTAHALNFRNGYCDQTAQVWGDGLQLLASTHQVVYYRD